MFLAFDTSTSRLSLAVGDEERDLAEVNLWAPRAGSERLFPALATILADVGVTPSMLAGIVVGLGPGSYTGLRIGVAAARGLAQVMHKPLLGLPSLDAIAYGLCASDRLLCPVFDAKRGQVYSALYRFHRGQPKRMMDFSIVSPRELVDQLLSLEQKTVLAGDALVVYGSYFKRHLGSQAIAPKAFWYPQATHLLDLARPSFLAQKKTDFSSVVPNYLRLSQAEESLKSAGS